MGRPKTVAPDGHIHTLNVYISDTQYVWLCGRAAAEGTSRADIVRQAIAAAMEAAK